MVDQGRLEREVSRVFQDSLVLQERPDSLVYLASRVTE
jgi:hypothetical protein